MRKLYFFLGFLIAAGLYSQEGGLTGTVADTRNGEPLEGCSVALEGTGHSTHTAKDGSFEFRGVLPGSYIVLLMLPGYHNKRLPVTVEGGRLDLGQLLLEQDLPSDTADALISLTEAELGEDAMDAPVYGLLNSGMDVFLRRAAFDFSQAFFKIRGYDSRNTTVLLNGFPMNSLYDGRPQWNHWGGLNDVGRNQELTYGLRASDYCFGGLLGSSLIDMRPSGLRPGYRFSGSFSDRAYKGRVMGTYVSGQAGKPFEFAVSASRRWAGEGQVKGTLYDAWSVFAALEYRLNSRNNLVLTTLLASNRRGRSAALTGEVARLLGSTYNPYWGYQNGEQRNSRERLIREPLFQFNYHYQGERSSLDLGAQYQAGSQRGSRLGYFNAPNPDPVYYRYLPSYAVNNPGGANFISADLAREALLLRPQLNWEALYRANSQGEAAYLLYDDVSDNRHLAIRVNSHLQLGRNLDMDAAGYYRLLSSDLYSQIADLLGAAYHKDTDPFSATSNDIEGPHEKIDGDIFGYYYGLSAAELNSFLQLRYERPSWEALAAASFTRTQYQREGYFRNERYPETSSGSGEPVSFTDLMIKGGFRYHIGGRHWGSLYGSVGSRAPLLKHTFINPRENNLVVPGLKQEQLASIECNYDLRLPDLTARFGAFYTRILDKTDIRFFFVDAGLGSDFVQEVSTGLDHLYMGLEAGLEYDFTPSLKGSAVVSLGKYRYASDPLVAINFDTAGPEEDLINPDGHVALGPAKLKDSPLAAGPQHALAIGLEYRDPAYWWLGVTANYLGGNFLHPSALIRTRSFLIDPETGQEFPGTSPELVEGLLARHPLDTIYLLNLTGGKSWMRKGVYISLFASVSNFFDAVFTTGGYEQSRNGNYGQWVQDNLSGMPSFGPKLWYGYGRTFFVNLAVSF